MGTLPPEQVEVRAPVDDTHPVHRLHKGFKLAKGIRIRPWHILSICWRTASPASKCVNMLWPTVPIALGVKFTNPDLHLAIFILSYIAMVVRSLSNVILFVKVNLGRTKSRKEV